ncbi:MAG: amidohydrolase family protein [Clostridia bacterium]|nr:amidohydrolase family protein [Clostridia bacterium]
MLDTLIKNGLVLDGSGNGEFAANVGVKDGKIAYLGDGIPEAGETVDAAGKYVTPGLIDIHRHADAEVLRPGFGEQEISQGLTTIVNGQCGLSISPCPQPYKDEILDFLAPVIGNVDHAAPIETTGEYFRLVESRGLMINVGHCIGDGVCRMAAKGFVPGAVSDAEYDRIHEVMREGLDAGALGVTTGIVYAPETCYDADGLVRALEPMRDYGVPLVTHIRGYGDILHKSLDEIIEVASRLEVPLHVSHMMAVGRQNWGVGLNEALAKLDRARQSGLRVSCDVYPYTAGASQLIQILPPWYQEGGVPKIIERLSDPKLRAELVETLKKPSDRFENLLYSTGWDALLVTTLGLEKNQQYVGKTVSEIARMQGKDPYDCAFDLLIEEKCKVTMVIFITDERDIINILRYPFASVISDSIYPSSGLPHPRAYGSFPKVLGEFVRDRKLLELPQAVRKMTGEPAKLYRIGKKGLIREGYDADLCVFDLNAIGCDADYVAPKRYAYGMDRVYVAGRLAYHAGEFVCRNAGRLVRRVD